MHVNDGSHNVLNKRVCGGDTWVEGTVSETLGGVHRRILQVR